jgi:cytoskeletal protein RodZ
MTFGENLRREREMRGVELREIADATKISIRFLQALEMDRPDVLPGGLFPQAFVRQYARYLGLDADKVVADFVYAQRGETSERPQTAVATTRQPGSTGPVVGRIGVVAAALVLALGLFVWSTRGSAPETPAAVVVPSAPPVVRPEDRVYPPPSVVATDAPANPDALVLKLTARQSCWVKVQVDRLTVLNRTLQQDETQTFDARKEIVLNVGNAGGLAYTINGRPGVSLGKEGEVKSNIVITRETLSEFLEGAARPAPRPAASPTSTPSAAAPAPVPEAVSSPAAPGPGR